MKNTKAFDRFAKGKQLLSTSSNKCVIYTRVSTKEQAQNNMSLETQRKACEAYSKKQDYTIMAFFGGTYESAKTDERIEFNNMLSFLRSSRTKISFIVVYSVDRFSRSGGNAIYIAEQLKKEGISLISVSQPTDVNTPSGILQQNIQFIFSEYDNQLRRDKCIAGMREKLMQGIWCVKPPKGYDIITINGKRSIVPNKDAEFVRKAFLLKYYERLSQVEIHEKITAMGSKIRLGHLHNIIKNPFYCGILSNRLLLGKVVEGVHEKIISKELFLSVNEMLCAARKKNESLYTDVAALPLRRFVCCHKCNQNMTGYEHKIKKIHYYKCSTKGCCSNKNAYQMHEQFADILKNIRIDEKNFPDLKNEFTQNLIQVDKIAVKSSILYSANLTVLNDKVDILQERFALGEIDRELYERQLEKFIISKKETLLQIDKARAGLVPKPDIKEEAQNILSNLSGAWLMGNLKIKRIIQNSIFPQGIYYNKHINAVLLRKLSPGFYLES